jgi:hypothetical protein
MVLLHSSLSLPDLGVSSNFVYEHPHPTVASPHASRPTNALPDLAVPGTDPPSTYLQPHTTSTATPLNNSMNPPHSYFRSHILRDGLPSQQQALPSQQRCISLSRSHSTPVIQSMAAQPSSHDLFSDATEAQYQRRSSCHSVTTGTNLPSLNSELALVAPSRSSADSAASWVYRRAEESLGVSSTIPTSGAHT